MQNKKLYALIVKDHDSGVMSKELVGMFQEMIKHYISKPKYEPYEYKEDMKAYAMMTLCRTWTKFNPKLSDDAKSYYEVCIISSFIQYTHKEWREGDTRINYALEHQDDEISYVMAIDG